MGSISFFASLLVSAFLLHGVDAGYVGYPAIRSSRKALQAPSPAGSSGKISPRVLKFYPVVQEFKKRVAYDPQGILKTWNPNDKNVCNYKGFYCDVFPADKQLTVSGVDFNGFQFAGKKGQGLTLYGFIEKLTDITVFHANSNNFTGGIPKEISTIPYFFELDLSNNKLDGKFPLEVLGAKQLTFLDLRYNSLYGTVPPQLFLLEVNVIFINDNYFEQNLPDNLGSTPANYLTFANNKFTGPIPPSIGQASKTLTEVLFLNNKLTGCLPFEIGHLENATAFDVSINSLTGPIPQSFQCLFSIEVLSLAQNQFYGSVPEAVCKLPNLGLLDISENYFSKIGPECQKLIKKKVLDPKKNCIQGLPNQRSKAECDAFLSKPKSCPNQKSLTFIPCKGAHPPTKSTSPSTLLTYGALKPHS
jgi:hypothetical protein